MKSALNTLSCLTPFPTTAVQVITPVGKQNTHEENQDNYDAQAYWECNFDNNPAEYRDRCLQPKRTDLQYAFVCESICRKIEVFDYEAAYLDALTMQPFFSPLAIRMLEAAKRRLRLDPNAADKLPKEERRCFCTGMIGEQAMLMEYLLWLQLKEARGDLSDFVRGVTPAIYRLSFSYLEDVVGWHISDYCVKNQTLELSINSLSNDELGRKYLSILRAKFGNPHGGPLSSEICVTLICGSDAPEEDRKYFRELRQFEHDVRNCFAHDICAISQQQLKVCGKLSSKDVLDRLKRLAESLLHQPLNWDSYDRMNRRLIDEVKTGAAKQEYSREASKHEEASCGR